MPGARYPRGSDGLPLTKEVDGPLMTPCWVIPTAPNPYPYVGYEGRGWHAHVLFFTKHVREVPEGLYVLHRCDNGNCVNPKHLYLGFQSDNGRDRKLGVGRKGPQKFVADVIDEDWDHE